MKRLPKEKRTPLERMLAQHPKHCTFWLFGTDRHCSCGRDEARVQVKFMLFLLARMRLPMPATTTQLELL